MEKNLIFGGFSYTEGAEEGEFPAKGRRRKSFETSNCLCGYLWNSSSHRVCLEGVFALRSL